MLPLYKGLRLGLRSGRDAGGEPSSGDFLETEGRKRKRRGSIRKDFTANLQTAMIGEIDKFIMGQRPMSEWDAFIAEFNAQGYDAYIEAKNTML